MYKRQLIWQPTLVLAVSVSQADSFLIWQPTLVFAVSMSQADSFLIWQPTLVLAVSVSQADSFGCVRGGAMYTVGSR